ncbi:MAG: protein kinase, partial [Gammaproteobacteria bacterium]
ASAYCDGSSIPLALLYTYSLQKNNELAFTDIQVYVDVLVDYSLATLLDNGAIQVHQLVQEVLRWWMSGALDKPQAAVNKNLFSKINQALIDADIQKEKVISRVFKMLDKQFDYEPNKMVSGAFSHVLAPHIELAMSCLAKQNATSVTSAQLLNRVGIYYLYYHRNIFAASSLFEQAITHYCNGFQLTILSEKMPDTASPKAGTYLLEYKDKKWQLSYIDKNQQCLSISIITVKGLQGLLASIKPNNPVKRETVNTIRQLLSSSRASCAKLVGLFSQRVLLISYNFLSFCFYNKRDMTQADVYYKKAHVIYDQEPATQQNLDYAFHMRLFGYLLRENGESLKAVEQFERSLLLQRQLQSGEVDLSNTLTALAYDYSVLGRQEAALEKVEEALAIKNKLYGTNKHLDIAAALFTKGVILANQKNFSASLTILEECLAIYQVAYNFTAHLDTAKCLHKIGLIHFDLQNIEQARPILLEARQLYSTLFPKGHPYINEINKLLSRLPMEKHPSYDELLKQVLENVNGLEISNLIAESKNAKVFKAVYQNKAVVVKIMKEKPKHAILQALTQLEHPQLIPIHKILVQPTMIMMDYIESQPLSEVLVNKPEISWARRLQIAREVAEGLVYLHQHNLCCNLVSKNILYDNNDHIKLTPVDVCSNIKFTTVNMNLQGTIMRGTLWGWNSFETVPEEYEGGNLKYSDIYLYGILLWQIITQKPFGIKDNRSFHQLKYKFSSKESNYFKLLPIETPLKLQKLLGDCLEKNPKKRPNAEKILSELNQIKIPSETADLININILELFCECTDIHYDCVPQRFNLFSDTDNSNNKLMLLWEQAEVVRQILLSRN